MDESNVADPPHVEALKRAIRVVGSQAELAQRLSRILDRPTVKQQTISYWLSRRVWLDAEWWDAIEEATGREVTREDLRPDIFRAHRPPGVLADA